MRAEWPFLLCFACGVFTAEKCVVPILENGRAREKGKVPGYVRFACRREFQLLGHKYAHCVRGSWDVETPICTKPGCKWTKPDFLNGLFLESYRGALVKVVCNPGYTTAGPSTVFCNGRRWNGTFPSCKPKDSKPATGCDFEGGLCGWSNDPENKGIDWEISADTTFHPPLSGRNYVYIKLLGQKNQEQTSRLFSPVYQPTNMSQTVCFKYSLLLKSGNMKMYVLMEGETLEETIPNVWYTPDFKPTWAKDAFMFSAQRHFQIVVEGLRGEMALDDVGIVYDEACLAYLISTTTTEFITQTDAFDTAADFTCEGRCMNSAVLFGSDVTADQLDEEAKCSCFETCISSGTCCHDYSSFCSSPSSSETTEVYLNPTEITEHTSMEPYTVPAAHPNENRTIQQIAFPTAIFSQSAVTTKMPYIRQTDPDYLNIQIPKKPLSKFTVLPRKNVNVAVIETTKSTSRATPSTSIGIPSTSIGTPSTSQGILNTSRGTLSTSTSRGTPSTTRRISKISTTVMSTTYFPAKTTSTRKSLTNNNKVSNHLPVLNSPAYEQPNRISWPNGYSAHEGAPPKGKEVRRRREENLSLSTVAEMAAAAAVVVVAIAGVAFLLKRRIQSRYQSNLVEDSDVRFLTSDEDLDFTLATPADSEL